MVTLHYERKRLLIWGKTAPELSRNYYETVCTGGVLEDGTPIRLYPIDFRYLDDQNQFKKYQWITAGIAKNPSDPRPESHRIDCHNMETGEVVPTDEHEWGKRQAVLFQNLDWQFDAIEGPGGLMEAHDARGTSLAVLTPHRIVSVSLHRRPDSEAMTFEEKRAQLQRKNAADRDQLRILDELMPPEMKGLQFIPNRVLVNWRCHSPECNGHSMQVMDWEVVELQRREGDDAAVLEVQKRIDLEEYGTRFFVGNMHQHPTSFSIVGLWYPKRAKNVLF